jgi:hypothetical protein
MGGGGVSSLKPENMDEVIFIPRTRRGIEREQGIQGTIQVKVENTKRETIHWFPQL